MRNLIGCLLVALLVFLVACDDNDSPAPTRFVVITASSTPDDPSLQITLESIRATNIAMELTLVALRTPLPSQSVVVTNAEVAVAATPTLMPTETVLPSAFPTPRVELVSTVEQVFEHGRMIWFRENRMIWVLVGDGVDPESGDWLCFQDTFVENDIEFLPTFNPPPDATTDSTWVDSRLQQPIRGFGKIWRDNPQVREQLGWALTSEIEHSARREYVAGGRLDLDQNYIAGPGEWRVNSFYGDTLIMYETELNIECPSGTWRLRRPS